jgi:hypothetical protein
MLRIPLEMKTTRTTIYCRDQAQNQRPHRGDEIGEKGIVQCRITTDILEDIKTVTLYNIFWEEVTSVMKAKSKMRETHEGRYRLQETMHKSECQ